MKEEKFKGIIEDIGKDWGELKIFTNLEHTGITEVINENIDLIGFSELVRRILFIEQIIKPKKLLLQERLEFFPPSLVSNSKSQLLAKEWKKVQKDINREFKLLNEGYHPSASTKELLKQLKDNLDQPQLSTEKRDKLIADAVVQDIYILMCDRKILLCFCDIISWIQDGVYSRGGVGEEIIVSLQKIFNVKNISKRNKGRSPIDILTARAIHRYRIRVRESFFKFIKERGDTIEKNGENVVNELSTLLKVDFVHMKRLWLLVNSGKGLLSKYIDRHVSNKFNLSLNTNLRKYVGSALHKRGNYYEESLRRLNSRLKRIFHGDNEVPY